MIRKNNGYKNLALGTFKNYQSYPDAKLVDNNITIENNNVTVGDSLKIVKEDAQYRLLFTRHNSEQIENRNCLSIRISNSGSRYMPFNSCFMNFYNKLQNIDPNNYQQHIEEFIYKQKVKK